MRSGRITPGQLRGQEIRGRSRVGYFRRHEIRQNYSGIDQRDRRLHNRLFLGEIDKVASHGRRRWQEKRWPNSGQFQTARATQGTKDDPLEDDVLYIPTWDKASLAWSL
jgi:hypothetical protein